MLLNPTGHLMATIPVNSLLRHTRPLHDMLAAAADQVIGSGYFVLGPAVKAFEAAFASYVGTAHCIGVANGTDALELALKAVGVGPGSPVAVCANAAMYGTSSVLACGGEPVFVDIDAAGDAMDPAALERAIAANPGIRTVVITHLYGRMARMADLMAVATAGDLKVVEDCAQAHGARLADGRRAGAIGDISCFSFYPTKNLGALGDGGAVLTQQSAIAERVAMLRQYGWTQKYTNGLVGGRNSRLDEIQAAMLLGMLPLLDAWNARRREIASRYSTGIRHPGIQVPPATGEDYVAHLYVVRCSRREALRAHLASLDVQSEIHYPSPDHRQPCHGGRFDTVSLPVTELRAETVLTLPCFPELSDHEVQQVIDACNSF
jgi:dTDP-4-amino-4,6-dideoxygalactose transaminase